ncbi:MAG: DUF1841 family protein [Methylobacillus sp.]|jgi:hypothetical protein|nr:DUF1841 family protein [Methylobacillus sp.]
MSLFNPSRDQARQFFFEAWRKFHANEPLTALEKMVAHVMQMHPEYHPVLDMPEHYREQEYFPEMGETNPFLHMSLHLSVMEQISIDQPPGIAAAYRTLCERHGDEMTAQHALMECLAETLWRAQRDHTAPDQTAYLEAIRRVAEG